MTAPDDRPGAAGFVPPGAGLRGLRDAAAQCHGCELYRDATQTVFSKGWATARVALVGEQPGDVEDREGAPFVGPAGRLLDRALTRPASTAGRRTSPTPSSTSASGPTVRAARRIH